MNKNEPLKDWARLGIKSRLKEIQTELHLMHSRFPDLFPGGPAVIEPLEREPVKDRKKKAKRLVDEAKKMHAGRKKKETNGADETDEFLTISQASKLFGGSEAGLRYHVTNKNIKIADKKGPMGSQRVRRADVIALGQKTGRIKAEEPAEGTGG